MDEGERELVAAEIARTRQARGLSAAALAKRADISENTMTRLGRGKPVHPQTLRKVWDALGIEPALDVNPLPGYPADIELVRDTIGLWLLETDPAQRPAVVRRILRAAAER